MKVTSAPAVVGKLAPSIFADEFVNVTDLVNGAKFVGRVLVVVNEQGVPPVIGNVALLLLIFDDPFTKVTGTVVPVPYPAPAAAGPAVIV